jgi:hypothetical protein
MGGVNLVSQISTTEPEEDEQTITYTSSESLRTNGREHGF